MVGPDDRRPASMGHHAGTCDRLRHDVGLRLRHAVATNAVHVAIVRRAVERAAPAEKAPCRAFLRRADGSLSWSGHALVRDVGPNDPRLLRAFRRTLGSPLRPASVASARCASRLSHLHPRHRSRRARVELALRMDRPMSEVLVLVAIALVAFSGFPGLLLPRGSSVGERLAALFMVAGSTCGLVCAFGVLASNEPSSVSIPWRVPGGEFALQVDGISAMFLAQIFLIAPLGSVYGLGYWKQADHPETGRKLRLFFGLLTAAMALLVVAHNSLLFLLGWETMALSAFLLITTKDTREAVRETGFVYIVSTRIGTLCLFAMFALLHAATGGWKFAPPGPVASPSVANAIFLLALAGFGLKAGMMPVHVWLPGAHANAPSHVSALMSGVLIKTGIYGIARVCSFFEHPPIG